MAFAEGIRLSDVAKRLKIGPMKRLYKYYNADSINLAGGLPMESCFPFEQVKVKLFSGDEYALSKGSSLILNYHRGSGVPMLADWLSEHVKQIHNPRSGYQTCMSCGSTDALSKTITLIKTDSILFDQYAYGAAVTTAEALGKLPIGVPGDSQGMIPDALRRSILAAKTKGLSPRLLYLVPVGQNPTGLTMSVARKREILDVCREQDIAIVEDGNSMYLT
ncbi:hypothetical protein EON65_33460 [archaeon]|nr:MAG: hypothetical protein EON65_33460 [archaeon]